MERPNERNRWDNPLFFVEPEDEPQYKEICRVLFEEKKKSKDPVSTKQHTKLGKNYIYEVEKLLQETINNIIKGLNQNKQLNNNKYVKYREEGVEINMRSTTSLGDLKKLKNEFLNINKINPFSDKKAVINGFLYYLKSKLHN